MCPTYEKGDSLSYPALGRCITLMSKINYDFLNFSIQIDQHFDKIDGVIFCSTFSKYIRCTFPPSMTN